MTKLSMVLSQVNNIQSSNEMPATARDGSERFDEASIFQYRALSELSGMLHILLRLASNSPNGTEGISSPPVRRHLRWLILFIRIQRNIEPQLRILLLVPQKLLILIIPPLWINLPLRSCINLHDQCNDHFFSNF